MASSAERIGTFEPESPEWHAVRAGGLGASEIAAVVGLSPWESHFSLWHRKAGLVAPQEETAQMSWGKYLEEPIARRFADEHPELRVRRTGTWRSKARHWQLCNPDRLVTDRGGLTGRSFLGSVPLEIKWMPYSDGWGKSGTEEIPVHYRAQVMWQLDVLGAPYGYLAALVGADYREYVIEYDIPDALYLREHGERFVASLPHEGSPGHPPDIDATGHTYRALKELHPDIDDREVEIDEALAVLYRSCLADAREAGIGEQFAKNTMLEAMGTARRAVYDGERIAIRCAGPNGTVQLRESRPPKATGQTVRDAL